MTTRYAVINMTNRQATIAHDRAYAETLTATALTSAVLASGAANAADGTAIRTPEEATRAARAAFESGDESDAFADVMAIELGPWEGRVGIAVSFCAADRAWTIAPYDGDDAAVEHDDAAAFETRGVRNGRVVFGRPIA